MQFGRKSEKIDRQIEKLECWVEDLLAEEGVIDAQPPAQRASNAAHAVNAVALAA